MFAIRTFDIFRISYGRERLTEFISKWLFPQQKQMRIFYFKSVSAIKILFDSNYEQCVSNVKQCVKNDNKKILRTQEWEAPAEIVHRKNT